MTDKTQALTSNSPSRWKLEARSSRDMIAIFVVVATLYYLLCRLALLLLSDAGVAVFWPASGLAAGAIVVLNPAARWPIVLAVVTATLAANFTSRSSLPLILSFALCNGIECLAFGWLMRKLNGRRELLQSLASVAAFLASAALAPGLAATAAALALQHIGGSTKPVLDLWFDWFKSDALGIIALAPMILTLPAVLNDPPRRLSLVEGILGVLLAACATYYAFGIANGAMSPVITPASLLFPVVLWLAARAPSLFSGMAVFVVAVIIVISALAGEGRFDATRLELPKRLVAAQMAIFTASCAALTLSAMFARYNNVARALSSSERRLRLSLAAGRMYAFEFDIVRGEVHRAGGLIGRLGLPAHGTMAEFLESIDPSERNRVDRLLGQLSPAGPTAKERFHMRSADGEDLVIEYRSEAEFDAAGQLVKVIGTCVDVTELETARAQLEGALQAGHVFAFEYDDAMRTVRRSSNAAEILGVPVETARTSRNLILDLGHPDDLAVMKAYGIRSPSGAFKSATFRILRPDGRTARLEVQSTAFFDERGRMIRMRGLARDVTERDRATQRQAMLLAELDHRVKNALARMAVVVDLSREGHQTLDDYVAVIQGRIASMARTQERLSSNKWAGVSLETLVKGELEPYRRGENCQIAGPDVVLEPDAAQAFAFTLHELATNAVKHGALAQPGGKVSVEWSIEPSSTKQTRALRLAWRELASFTIAPPQRESYGMTTIRRLLDYEQGADVRVDFTPSGLHVDIEMPLPDSDEQVALGPEGAPEIKLDEAAQVLR